MCSSLCPGISPLSSFVWCLEFREATKKASFQTWLEKDLIQFCKLEKDLRMGITEEWNRIKKFNGSFAGNVSSQENVFKILITDGIKHRAI